MTNLSSTPRFRHSCNNIFYRRVSAQAEILLAEILISPRVLFAEFMASCEPLHCAACSNDLRWRMVLQREVLELSCGEHSTVSVAAE